MQPNTVGVQGTWDKRILVTSDKQMTHLKKRLLIITNGLEMGGAEVQLIELASRLQRERGWQVGVVSLLGPGVLSDQLAKGGVEEFSLGLKGGVPNPVGILRLAKLVRSWKPTVVHSHMVRSNLITRLARLFCRMPVLVCTAHNVFEHMKLGDFTSKLMDNLYRITDWLADTTTTICKAAESRYLAEGLIARDRSLMVYNGINADLFRPDSSKRAELRKELGLDGFIWLSVGRFNLQKDWPNMLRAFAQLVHAAGGQFSDHKLVIAGKGPLQGEAEQLARSLGIEQSVRFLGLRRDVEHLMMASDAYVMSSRWEGFPIVLLEAAASALPIVATDVGGNREIVENGVSGLLMPAADSQALAVAMQTIAEMEPEARLAMGLKGRHWVETHLNFSRILDQWEALYSRLLSARGLKLSLGQN